MLRQPFCNFTLAGMSLNEYGLEIPSPFSSLELSNSEITSMTSWTLTCVVGGDSSKKANQSAFEALLYSAAQAASGYSNSSGIPVSFIFGWLENGVMSNYISYTGFTINFKVSTNGLYMIYTLTGYASLAMQSSLPVLNIPEVEGIVQPSALVEALAKSSKMTSYYQLDIDHNDAPTLVSHGAMSTSFNKYVRGTYSTKDEYSEFPGLLKLSKSFNTTRDSAGLKSEYRSLSQVMNNRIDTPMSSFLKAGLTDNTVQSSSFSYWLDEPTMTQPGVLHYKSNANLINSQANDVLEYGTANTNILSLDGSYNGVAYNVTDFSFAGVGFVLDGSGNTIIQDAQVVNSWSSSLADAFQTVNIINDMNALASQFSGDFSIQIAGDVRKYSVAQPVSLLVVSGNTISPVTGVYNIVSVSHKVAATFVTTLKIQRLTMSSANSVASTSTISSGGSNSGYPASSYSPTSNIKTPYYADFGTMYPTFEDMRQYV